MSYTEHVAEHRRLAILQVTAGSDGYTCNEFMLGELLADDYGHRIGGDLIRTELAWLAEQGLIKLRDTGDVRIATLTSRGSDVAMGKAVVPGVKRPGPGGVA